MNDTAPAQQTCFDCNLPRSSHANDGAIYVEARSIYGKPVLYCAGFKSRPSRVSK